MQLTRLGQLLEQLLLGVGVAAAEMGKGQLQAEGAGIVDIVTRIRLGSFVIVNNDARGSGGHGDLGGTLEVVLERAEGLPTAAIKILQIGIDLGSRGNQIDLDFDKVIDKLGLNIDILGRIEAVVTINIDGILSVYGVIAIAELVLAQRGTTDVASSAHHIATLELVDALINFSGIGQSIGNAGGAGVVNNQGEKARPFLIG